MTIEQRTEREFLETLSKRGGGGRPISAEAIAIQSLEIGKALSAPCRWNHTKGGCMGVQLVASIRRRSTLKLRSFCHEGFLWVLRLPDKKEAKE